MCLKIIVLIFVSLTEICGTPLDFNGGLDGGVCQKREITFQQCKNLQIEMIEYREDFGIVKTILIAIFLLAMMVLIVYCCSKREFF